MNSIQHPYSTSADGSARKGRIHSALISCALFKSASATTLETALAAASMDVVPRNKPIVQQGTTAQALALLASGHARVERSLISGNHLPLGYRTSGELAGECALVGAENYTENVRIPTSATNSLMRSDPALSQTLMRLVLQRQAETEDRLTSLLFRTVEGRVVEFLLHAANRWGVADARGTMISAPLTHLEIAKAIGSTRETVTVTLGILRRDGLLEAAGRRLIVVDRDGLAKRK